MTPAFWVLFAAACLVCLVAVPVSVRIEERARQREKQAWRKAGGGRL